MTQAISILIIDDQPLFANALSDLIMSSLTPLAAEVILSGNIKDRLVEKADLVLMSLCRTPFKDINLFSDLLARFSNQKFLVLLSDYDDFCVQSLLAAGVKGVLSKNDSAETFLMAMRSVLDGSYYLSHFKIAERPVPVALSTNLVNEKLTPREQEVFDLLIAGKSNQQIADILCLANQTIRNRLSEIYNKLDMHTRAEVISHYAPQGY